MPLKSTGHSSVLAEHGHLALEILEGNNEFDVMICDMIMEEGFDGLIPFGELYKSNLMCRASSLLDSLRTIASVLLSSSMSVPARTSRILENYSPKQSSGHSEVIYPWYPNIKPHI